MKQNLQKRRLTTISQDLRCAFVLFFLVTAISSCSLPAVALSAEDEAEIRDLVNRGNALLNAARYKEALEEYEAVLQIDPQNHYGKANQVLAHNKWALSLFRQRKYKEAREHWDTAHKLNPNDPTVNQNLKVLEFHLKKLGIDEDEPEPDRSASTTFDPLRENPNDWSPFKRSGQGQTNSAQVAGRPAVTGSNPPGQPPPMQTAQGAASQQTPSGPVISSSGPQLLGGIPGSTSAAPSGPVILSGGTTAGVPDSGGSSGPSGSGASIISGGFNTSDPGAVSNYGSTFSLSGGTSNADPADYSGVKIMGGSAPPSQTANQTSAGLPLTEHTSPIPGSNSSTASAPAGGYSANAGPTYEAASQTASGAILTNPGNAGTSAPIVNGAPIVVNAAPIASAAPIVNAPPVNSPPINSAPAYEPMGNVNMSYGTAGNVIIPPPSNRHGTGTAYKFPSNIVPPRAAPGFLREAPPSARANPTNSGSSGSTPENSSPESSYDSQEPEPELKVSDNNNNNKTNTNVRPPTANDSSDSSATVNKVLSQIEIKVYGKTREDLPILKRLERIEIDTVGKKVIGSINDRLNKLKETYGL